MSNIPLRLTSLLLAILLWLAIAAEKTSEMGIVVPIELQNVPKDMEVTGDTVNSVEVRLRASPGIIQRLGPGEVTAQIDLAGAEEGERIVHLTGETIRVPFGVKVVKINPSLMRLDLERTLEKVVPVRPRLVGRPAAGFEVAEVASEPAEVRIAGPKSRALEIESAFTEPVSVEGARSNVEDSVNLGLDDPALRIRDQPRVRVVARIREAHGKRTLPGLPVTVRGGAATPRPGTVAVTVSGPASLLARLDPGEVKAYVDASRLAAAEKRPVAVELASGYTGVSVERAEPSQILVRPSPSKVRR